MGRKRKEKHVDTITDAVQCSTVATEDKTSNARPEATTEEKLDIHTDSTNAAEVMNVEKEVQANSEPSETKTVAVRRSCRLKNSSLSTGIPAVSPVVEHVNLVGNKTEEGLNSQQVSTLPVVSEENLEQEPQVEQANTVPNVNERNLEEKVDYLVQAVDEFKTKTVQQVFGRPREDLSYKSLYIDAQKKIEALMEENYALVKKLEFTLGKIEAYEKMKDAAGASKEVILVSNMAKATEVTVSLSPQKVQKRIPSAAALGAADKSKRNKKN